MARIGIDPTRSELPGTPNLVAVSARWVQRGINAWRVFTRSTIAAVAEDGVWGPRTEAAFRGLVSQIDPGSSSSIRPTPDNRAVIISRKLEGYIASLERVSGAGTTATPVIDFTPSTDRDLVASSPEPGTELVVGSGATPVWVYAIAGASFLAAAGVTYAVLNTK